MRANSKDFHLVNVNIPPDGSDSIGYTSEDLIRLGQHLRSDLVL